MTYTKAIAPITILFIFLFSAGFVSAINQENPLAQAIRLFDNGKFEEAEIILKKLLDQKPDHLMVNYYYGACRTENGHYDTNEIIYLLNGSLGESPLKTDYYIAVQYHAKNRWDDALKYYKLFGSKADAAIQNEVQLKEKIQLCTNKINPFAPAEDREEETASETDILPTAVPRETQAENFSPVIGEKLVTGELLSQPDSVALSDSISSDSLLTADLNTNSVAPTLETGIILPAKLAEPINFVVNTEITYPDTTFFKTPKGLKVYLEGQEKQKHLEQTINETDELRKKYGASNSYSEKQLLGKQILDAETTIYQLREETAALLLEAQQEENSYWQNATSDEKHSFRMEVNDFYELFEQQKSSAKPDTVLLISPSVLPAEAVIPTENNTENSSDLIYKIQLGAYSRGLPAYVKRLFDKLSYIRKIEHYTDEKGIVVYTTGNLSNYDDALKMQEQVRQEGVEDAFVVPYFNGKRITLSEAKEIENDK
ncbi:SPOR domain-containing protein [uncultured Draconibacterium sp.]|uniref:SPOR domain-containing protein n=1 Tax=uncultured Draconibacterium sp. TaxID=1573823 RepID=UPI003260BBD2